MDVQAEGAGLPTSPDLARKWFAERADIVRKLLKSIADSLPAGVDPGDVPMKLETAVIGPKKQKLKLSISAAVVRRADGLQFAKVLADLAENWDEYVTDLIPA